MSTIENLCHYIARSIVRDIQPVTAEQQRPQEILNIRISALASRTICSNRRTTHRYSCEHCQIL
jgi:predicted SprT family Zn-dependent metalloprotease